MNWFTAGGGNCNSRAGLQGKQGLAYKNWRFASPVFDGFAMTNYV